MITLATATLPVISGVMHLVAVPCRPLLGPVGTIIGALRSSQALMAPASHAIRTSRRTKREGGQL